MHNTSQRRSASAAAIAVATSVAVAIPAAAQEPSTTWGSRTTLATVNSAERQANGPSYDNPSLSRHGRLVAYESDATNLVRGDTNGAVDVFVRNRGTGTTKRVSVSSTEQQGNDASLWPSMSASGRYVAFTSAASNLVRGDTNGLSDVFVRDRKRGTTTRISLGPGGRQGSKQSYDVVLSADGTHAVFVSDAPNLVRGDTNKRSDVFVRDLRRGVTKRVSVGPRGQGNAGSFGRAISTTGRYVAFVSDASNLVKGDTNGQVDVFLRDTVARTTTRVTLGPGGVQADAGDPMGTGFPQAVSPGGRFVLFDHDATNLVKGDTNGRYDVFVRDLVAQKTRRLSVAPDGSQLPDDSFLRGMSADGRKVLLSTYNAITAGDRNFALDVFVLDRKTRRMQLVSVATNGRAGNDDSGPAAISADGRHVAFLSHSSNLVAGDRNGESDMFVRSR